MKSGKNTYDLCGCQRRRRAERLYAYKSGARDRCQIDRLVQLGALAHGGAEQMSHAHRLALAGGQCGGGSRDIPDICPAELQARQPLRIEAFDGRIGRENAPPDLDPLRHVGKCKIHGEGQAPQEGWVDILAPAGRQDHDAGKRLDALEEEIHLRIRATIRHILGLAALAEQRIGFIE
ncbi:MAG TPA: hypothetical protein VGH84_14830, partial [Steroidobacteraceae bacterium]